MEEYGQPLTGLNTKQGQERENKQLGRMPITQYNKLRHIATPLEEYVGVVGMGDSRYDKDITTESELRNLSNARGELQPGWHQVLAGIAKGGVLAGTTLVDGLVGLPLGVALWANGTEGAFSVNNPISLITNEISQKAEEAIPNYYADAEKESPWTSNILSANFLGDKLLKNMGFMVGAFYSGNIYGALLKGSMLPNALGKLLKSASAPKIITSGFGASVSAINEGRIEAINHTLPWYETNKMKIEDSLEHQRAAIERFASPEDKDYMLAKVEDDHGKAMEQLEKDKIKMSNSIIKANFPLLVMGNMIQFGKLYANGFKTASRMANIAKKGDKYISGRTVAKGMARATGNALTEGLEEMSQEVIGESSGLYYESDIMNFRKKLLDPDAEDKTLSWIDAYGEGLKEVANDGAAWEQFFIGSLSGGMGMPTFRSTKSESGKLQSPVTFSQGIVGEFKDYMEAKKKDEEVADYINAAIQSPETINYYQGIIRHMSYQNDMDNAAENKDEFSFKNAEHSQMVSDIAMFSNAGKLQELKDRINESLPSTEKDFQAIRESLDKGEGKKEVTPFSDIDGNPLSNEDILAKMTENKDKLLKTIDSYSKTREKLDSQTYGMLDDEQLTELTWMSSQIDNWKDRAATLSAEIKPVFQELYNTLNIRLNKTREARLKEGKTHKEPSEKYFEMQEEEAAIEARLKTLNTLLSVEPSKMAEELVSSPSEITTITNLIDTPFLGIAADKASETLTKVADVKKMMFGIVNYNNKLRQYLKDPDALVADINDADKAIMDKIEASKIEDAEKAVKNVDNIQDLKAIMTTFPREVGKKTLDKIKIESEDKKVLIQTYQDLEKLDKAVQYHLNTEESLENSTANILTKAIVSNASTVEEALRDLDNLAQQFQNNLEVSEQLKERVVKIKESFNASKESEKTTNKDENSPKKKPKSKKKFSLLEASDSEEFDAGMEEDNPSKSDEDKSNKINSSVSNPEGVKPEEPIKPTNRLEELSAKSSKELEEIAKSKAKEVDNNTKILATKIHNDRELPPVGESLPSIPSPKSNTPKIEESSNPTFRSDAQSKYEYNALKDRTKRAAIERVNFQVQELKALGTYDYVESGKLAAILKEDPDTKVHYITPSTGHLSGYTLLGIEVKPTSKIKSINPIVGQDGKSYQIVGTLTPNNHNTSKVKFDVLKRDLAEEIGNNTANYFVSTKHYNKVKRIYSGRMVKSSDTIEQGTRNVNKAFMGNTPFHLGIYYNSDVFKTPTLDEYQEIVSLNTNNNNPREGSIWLMTLEADGKYYPKAIQTKRFTEEEYPLSQYGDSPVVKEIKEYLKTIYTSKNDTERSLAKYSLERLLYFPKDHPLLFTGNVVSIKGIANDIGKGKSLEDAINATLEVLQSDLLNLRFQITPSELTDPSYVNKILDSEILTTDLLIPTNVNASFDLYIPSDEGGPIITDDVTKVHTGKVGVNSTIASTTVMVGKNRYELYSDGSIKQGDTDIIDQRTITEVKFINSINKGNETPVEGNDKLYIGHYSSGTEFGVMNNKILNTKVFNRAKHVAKRKAEREKLKENTKEVFEKASEEDVNKLLFMTKLPVSKEDKSEPKDIFEAASSVDLNKLGIEEDSESNSMFEDASEEDYAKLLGLDPTEVEDKSDEPAKLSVFDKITSVESLQDLDNIKLVEDFQKLITQNRTKVKELGFKNMKEFKDFVLDPNNNLPSLESLSTQEAFDALIQTIKECR